MKKIIYLISVIVTIGIFSSCNDFLIERPVLQQDSDITLSDFAGLDKATVSAYGYFYDNLWYGAEFVLSSELRGGNAKRPTNTDFSTSRYTNEYSWAFSSSNTSGLFQYAYRAIAAANNVINNVDGKEEPEVTTEDLNNLKAEGLFIRALGHFDLVRTYAQPYTYQPNSLGVPIVLESKLDYPARKTVAEVYDQVVKDLLDAETLIQPDYQRASVSDPFAVASKLAIQALLSRVYLYMGEWQKSADYATTVINSNKFNMFTAEELPTIWTKDNASAGGEVIFEIYGNKLNEWNGYWDEISWLSNPEGYADVCASADIRNLYEENDVRASLFQSHAEAPDHFWTTKYAGKSKTQRPLVSNIIVLRLSEMYLNRAEALAHGATIQGASVESDLKVITSNRNASDAPATLEGILLERRKELAFEGHLIYDMARTGTPVNRVDYQGAESARTIEFPSYRWALPIPLVEMNSNPNMEQNEGY